MTLMMESLATLGFVLVLVGCVVILVALVLSFLASAENKGRVKGGGALIIGPVPIVFGTDAESVKTLLILSIVLMVFVLLVSVVLRYL
jgi:uncharacterized protein (TIGR00304 family)